MAASWFAVGSLMRCLARAATSSGRTPISAKDIALPHLRGQAVPGDRRLHERLERARVDLLPCTDVDRPSRVAFQAGVEEFRGVRQARAPGERELHDLLVRLTGADDAVLRPPWVAP